MKPAVCLECDYARFNYVLEKWMCTRPGWKHYIDDPKAPIMCNFFRRKEVERDKLLIPLRVKPLKPGGSYS